MSSHLVVAESVRTARGALGNAVLVRDGTVAAIGPHETLRRPGLAETAYPGAYIVPGLRDAHIHPVPYTALLSGVSLKTARDLAEVSARLRNAAAGSQGPLIALRLDDESLAERRLPDRHELDAMIPDRPLLLHRYCGHIAVANTAALTLAGIDAARRDPDGGTIDRDVAGAPTGILRETAIEIVAAALAGSSRISPDAVVSALAGLVSLGITSIGAMVRLGDGPWASLGNEAEILAAAATRLPLRVHGYVIANSRAELDEGRRLLDGAGRRLRWAGLKRFADGSLGGHTAAMHEPFADEPTEYGTLRLDDLDRDLADACLSLGGTIAIHAIGDRACAEVIDLIADLEAPAGRARIEHASVLTATDIQRISTAGIVCCVQPAFLGSEADWLEHRLGRDRMPLVYPFRSMYEAGITLAAGSDSPVETPDPWSAMALARDRAGITPGQGLDPHAALELFTDGAASALGEPPPLSIGAPAEFVLVDRDPTQVSPSELRATAVSAVWIDGAPAETSRSRRVWVD